MKSYVDGGAFARRTISCNSAPCSAPGSPKSRVKFLCSHGGKILPRPSDGQLKYVGGETRVISVPLDISFQELMKRLTYSIEGEMILKYQLATEDLDSLVTVKSEEDMSHMFDEMEHYQSMGYPRMRTFLFPINHLINDNLPLDQRYIFSINGAVFSKHTSPTTTTATLASSTCTSPRSPDCHAAETFNSDSSCSSPWLHQNTAATATMPKIHSSPSICNLNLMTHYSSHQMHPQYSAYHNHSGFKSPNPTPPFDGHSYKSGALNRVVSMQQPRGRSGGDGMVMFQSDSAPPSYRCGSFRDQNQQRGSGYCSNCMHHDNCAHFVDRRSIDRKGTLP